MSRCLRFNGRWERIRRPPDDRQRLFTGARRTGPGLRIGSRPYGRRRVFLTGLAVFTISSMACGVVPNASVLVICRAVQALGAALLTLASLVSREIFPLADSFAAVRRAFDREHHHQRRLAKIFNCA
jgi:MFS family permease